MIKKGDLLTYVCMNRRDIHQKYEQEALQKLGLSLSEVLTDTTRFTHPTARQAIALAQRATTLLEREGQDAEAWQQLDADTRQFALAFYTSDFLPKSLREFSLAILKKLSTQVEAMQEVSTKIFAAVRGEPVSFEEYTFKDDVQYRERLYATRVMALQCLLMRQGLKE